MPWPLAEVNALKAVITCPSLLGTQSISDNAVLMSSQHFPNKVKQTTDFLNTKRPGVSVLSELDAELNHTIMGPESHLVQLFT